MSTDSKNPAQDHLPRHPSPEMLKAYLETHDAPCPVCGYNLRGVVLASCPECNAPIELIVGSAQAKLGAWLFAMLSFAMALGFDAVIGLLMVIPVVSTRGESGPVLFLAGTLVTLGLICIGMLWVLIVRKRVWMSLPSRRQKQMGATIFLGVFAIHLAVGVGFVLMVL